MQTFQDRMSPGTPDNKLDGPQVAAAASQPLGLRLFVGFLVVFVGTLLFSWLAKSVGMAGTLVQFDNNVALLLHREATPQTTRIFLMISMLGLQVLWIVCVAVALLLAFRRQWIHLITLLVAWLGGEGLNWLLKQVFARPRPSFPDPLISALDFSFPSGHAMFSAIAYGLLAYFLLLGVRHALLRVVIIVGAIVLVGLIGLSRIYLGVHYFSDVIAGFAAGSAWLAICITAMETIRYRRYRPASPAKAQNTDSTDNTDKP